MIAKIFPLDASIKAVCTDISFLIAAIKATSEEKGKIVAAKKAETKRAISEILCS